MLGSNSAGMNGSEKFEVIDEWDEPWSLGEWEAKGVF